MEITASNYCDSGTIHLIYIIAFKCVMFFYTFSSLQYITVTLIIFRKI